MSEPSTGQWADTIGQGLERIKAKMDLGVGPREFTFGNTRTPGLPLITMADNPQKGTRVHGLLPDERGHLGWAVARTKPENGGIRDTLGLESGTTPAGDWRSVVSGMQFPHDPVGTFGEPVSAGTIPSEEMLQGMKKLQEERPPSAEDLAGNRASMAGRVDYLKGLNLGKEEVGVRLGLSGRRGAFHLGTGAFRYVED